MRTIIQEGIFPIGFAHFGMQDALNRSVSEAYPNLNAKKSMKKLLTIHRNSVMNYLIMKTFSLHRYLFAILASAGLLGSSGLGWGQETYTWNATVSSLTSNASNWTPAGGPPEAADSVVFEQASPVGANAQVTGNFSVANVLFNRTSQQQNIAGQTSAGTLSVSGNITNSGASGAQFIMRSGTASSPLSVSVGGNLNLLSAITRFGTQTNTAQGIQDVTVSGTTSISSSASLTFGNATGTINLGNVEISGTMNPISGSTAGNGTFDGGTTVINMNRLHGNGIITGAKDLATLTTTGIIAVNGSSNGTFSGTMSNGLANNVIALTKAGSSTQTLTGNNTYTGSTVVSGGTLLISGTGAINGTSSITVNGTGTLNYASSTALTRNVTVSSGAAMLVDGTVSSTISLASGSRVGGNGSVTTGLTLGSGVQFVLNLTTPLSVTGAVSLNNAFSVASLVNLNGSSLDWSLVAADTYTLISNSSDFSNIQNFGFANRATGLAGGREAYFTGGTALSLVVIPEPSTWALITVGLCAMTLLRRRRS